MERHFEYEKIKDLNKVKFAITKFKGHAIIWWDFVRHERVCLNKERVRT